METYYHYNGFGIRYIQLTGTTNVEDCGVILKSFTLLGEEIGKKLAEKWINDINEYKN